MIFNHTLQTSAAFDRINDALLGNTDDDLDEIIKDLETFYNKAKKIKNICKSSDFGDDFLEPKQTYTYCNLPN
jgi:hypothetical protein